MESKWMGLLVITLWKRPISYWIDFKQFNIHKDIEASPKYKKVA